MKIGAEIDKLYDAIDDAFVAGQFNMVDLFLEYIDASQFIPEILVAILTITLPAKDKLNNRALFFRQVKSILEIGDKKDAEQTLHGLE